MILSERNPNAKSAWLTVRNTHGESRLQVVLELDGQEEILEDTWVPCLDSSESIHLRSHQLTNFFKGRDQEIKSFKGLIVDCGPWVEDLSSMIDLKPRTYEILEQWLTKTENIRVE